MDRDIEARLRERAHALEGWLRDEAPYTGFDQKHTQEHTPERAYWHHGYMMALRDVLRLAERSTASDNKPGKAD